MEKLESIVQRMIDAGEPEENIKAVIQEYSGKQNPTTPDAVVEEDTASNMDSSSESTSLESPEDPNRDKLIQLETELEATRSDPKTMNSDENFRKRKSLNKQIKELGGFKEIKEEKLEEVAIEPKEEVDVKRRAEFRKKAQEVLNGDNIYEFGIVDVLRQRTP